MKSSLNHIVSRREAVSGSYRRLAPLFFIFFVVLISRFGFGQHSTLPDTRPRLKTICDSLLWLFPARERIQRIPAGTIVVRSAKDEVERGGKKYIRVLVPAVTSFGKPLEGWMQEEDLNKVLQDFELEAKRIEALKNLPPLRLITDRERLDTDEVRQHLNREDLIILDFLRVYDENDGLPEPYFTRGRFLTKHDSHAVALLDYLEGLKCVKNEVKATDNKSVYVLYEKDLEKIDEVVRKTLQNPVPVGELGREARETAGRHFSQGYTAFWSGEYESDAARRSEHYEKSRRHFDNATVVFWQFPAYWYYRGLAHWRLGNKEQAAFDFLFASQMEKNLMNHAITSEYLTRLQGKDRMFLEQIRWGDPEGRTIKDLLLKP